MTIEEYSKIFWYHNWLKLIEMCGEVKKFLWHMKDIYDDNNARRTRYLNCLINPTFEDKQFYFY